MPMAWLHYAAGGLLLSGYLHIESFGYHWQSKYKRLSFGAIEAPLKIYLSFWGTQLLEKSRFWYTVWRAELMWISILRKGVHLKRVAPNDKVWVRKHSLLRSFISIPTMRHAYKCDAICNVSILYLTTVTINGWLRSPTLQIGWYPNHLNCPWLFRPAAVNATLHFLETGDWWWRRNRRRNICRLWIEWTRQWY